MAADRKQHGSAMGEKDVGKRDVQMSWTGKCVHSGQRAGKWVGQ